MKKSLQIVVCILAMVATGFWLARPTKQQQGQKKQHPDVGLSAYVPQNFWVEVHYKEHIPNSHGEIDWGHQCVIRFGGKITVVDVSPELEYTLRYDAPDDAAGSECPSGTIYSADRRPALEQMNTKYRITAQNIEDEKYQVNMLFRQGRTGRTKAVRADRWMKVKNPDGISNSNNFFGFDDSCVVFSGGHLVPFGQRDAQGEWEKLFEYRSKDQHTYGTECANGALIVY